MLLLKRGKGGTGLLSLWVRREEEGGYDKN